MKYKIGMVAMDDTRKIEVPDGSILIGINANMIVYAKPLMPSVCKHLSGQRCNLLDRYLGSEIGWECRGMGQRCPNENGKYEPSSQE